jgi:cyclophilin family peptidyl-prolyl cis-trans isomerase
MGRRDNGTHVPMNSRFGVRSLVALLLAAALLVIALACGSDSEEASPSAADDATTTQGAVTFPPVPTFESCPAPSGAAPEVQVKTFPQRPAMSIDPSKQYIAHIYTTRGHFIVELLPGIAPEHVNSFVFLAREKFYNGIVFHRVEPWFVVQTGDPTGTGSGSAGYTIPLEASDEPFVRGVVGMARSADPDSAGSQFFVTLGDAHHLDGQYTVFGKVVQGMEFVDCIEVGDRIIDIAIQEI